jgi:P27 family predicted phage terminase small subunit
MTGPPPKPAELRLLEGNPGKRRIPKTIRCKPMDDKPPAILGRVGRAEWRRIFETVGGVPGLLQEQDRPALTALCLTWEQYMAASELVQKAGVLVKSQGRNAERPAAVRNPALQAARDSLTNLMALWARFGMTPSDRARLEVPHSDEDQGSLAAQILSITAGRRQS